MIDVMDDHELPREYVRNQSQDAFRKLVDRHLAMVYGAARRMVRDGHLAEDVAQGVFQTLAEKAGTLRRHQVIAGWLYQTTRHLAMHAVRGEQRRREREQVAVAMQALDTEAGTSRILDELEPALDQLDAGDRDLRVLRYFEDRSLRDVGREVGISEDAVRMRVNRALERLRAVFEKRGVTASSALLSTVLLSTATIAVPSGLAATITTAALTGTGAGIGATAATGATVASWLTAKTTAAVAGAVAIAGAGLFLLVQRGDPTDASRSAAPGAETIGPSVASGQLPGEPAGGDMGEGMAGVDAVEDAEVRDGPRENRQPYFGLYQQDQISPVGVPWEQEWMHIVFQHTGQFQQIWINGRLLASFRAEPYQGVSGVTAIGKAPRWANVPARDFVGHMRDVRIYHRQLEPAEIGLLSRSPFREASPDAPMRFYRVRVEEPERRSETRQ
jgi:RNA polymerase sigma factor (sigma-70 family)